MQAKYTKLSGPEGIITVKYLGETLDKPQDTKRWKYYLTTDPYGIYLYKGLNKARI